MSAGTFFLLLLVVGIVWFATRSRGRGKPAAPSRPSGDPPRIRGPGRYEVEVVGESYHRDSFEALRRKHQPDDPDGESFGDAVLTLEDENPHDSQAVAVHLEGYPVGHLSRAMARDFRTAVRRDGLTQYKQFAVGARLYWGGEDRIYSVSIDLPQA